jgi:hypothetical protein
VQPAYKVLLHRAELAQLELRAQRETREIRVQRVLWDIVVLKESAETPQILVPPAPQVELGKPAKPANLETPETQVQPVLQVEQAQPEREAPLEILETQETRVQPEPVQPV